MSEKNCNDCANSGRPTYIDPCASCYFGFVIFPNNTIQSIEFKRLNGLTPTVESCTMKVLEEVGELMQLLGKERGLSGEKLKDVNDFKRVTRTVNEAMDVAQSAVTLIFELCERYRIPLELVLESHRTKLESKGYLEVGK